MFRVPIPFPPKSSVSGETWGDFGKVVFGTWMAIWFYAAVHNQYLIRIAPEHFTVWHYKMPFFTEHTTLGIAYAFAASFSPGVILGMGLYVAGRLSSRPKLSAKRLIFSTSWIWIGVEFCCGMVGVIVWRRGEGIYPEWIYPSDEMKLIITQSIQITAYLTGMSFSSLLIALTWRKRKPLA